MTTTADSWRELETPRLRLRRIGPQDQQSFFEIHSDAETIRYWAGDEAQTDADARRLIEREIALAEREDCMTWGMALPENDRLIGKFTLFQMDPGNRRAEVGFILNREFWGQGLMSEVLRTCIEFAISDLQIHRLEADVDPDNSASLAVLEKFGFQREGYFRERWRMNEQGRGYWADSVMLGLLQQDFNG